MCKMCDDNGGEMVGCQDCGRLICFDVKGYFGDDVVAPAYVTSRGDVFCLRCGRGYDEDEEKLESDDGPYTLEDIYPISNNDADVSAGESPSDGQKPAC